VAIVCGYGTDEDDRLRGYVEAVAASVHRAAPSVLIISGGFTGGPNRPSEAALIARLVRPEISVTEIIVEERAYSSLHNLLYAREEIIRRNLSDREIVIICDQVRALKVRILARLVFRESRTTVVVLSRAESLAAYLVQFPSTVVQVLGALFPLVARQIEKTRSPRWTRHGG
jgi:hypothetical protein